MAYDGIAKVQHYVPQFLLRNFGTGKKDKINVFDKQTDKAFATNAKNVAAESRFYDFEVDGEKFSFETSLSKLEAMAKPLIKDILEKDSIGHLSSEERTKLSVFLAVQFTRTKWFREQYRELRKMLQDHIIKFAGDRPSPEVEKLFEEPSQSEMDSTAAHFIAKAPENFAVHFASKMWVLLETDAHHPFMIGDNPIGLQNAIDMGPYGNLGLAVRGIEIYFPLTPRRALAMFCHSYVDLFRDAATSQGPRSAAGKIWTSFQTGVPYVYTPEMAMNFNSLQIRHAERFVFSSVDDFSLAKRMIADSELFRTGPRSTKN